MTPLFVIGTTVATPGAMAVLEAHGIAPIKLIERHVSGDWSEMQADDQTSNHEAIKNGCRVFSSYTLADEVKIWIITEADRSSTTILLPEEY
jgi:hypothetical protein